MSTLITVGVFILFDVVTGVLKALYNEGIDSTYLRKGLFHKLAEIIAVIGTMLFEIGSNYVNIKIDIPLLTIVASYICAMEAISVFENLAEINPSLGKLLKPYLHKLKEEDKDDEEK